MNKKDVMKLIKAFEELADVLEDLANNEEIDGEILKELSALNHAEIQAAVSMNPKTPSSILERWLELYSGVGGTDEEARIHMVYNPSLNIRVVKKMAENDPSEEVREAALLSIIYRVTKNQKTSRKKLLEYYELAEKKMFTVQRKKSALKAIREIQTMKQLIKHMDAGIPNADTGEA